MSENTSVVPASGEPAWDFDEALSGTFSEQREHRASPEDEAEMDAVLDED